MRSCLWRQPALVWPFTYLSDRRKVFWHLRFTNCIISYQDIKPNVMGEGLTFWEPPGERFEQGHVTWVATKHRPFKFQRVPARFQWYTDYSEQSSRIRTRHDVFKSTVKLFRGVIYFLQRYFMNSRKTVQDSEGRRRVGEVSHSFRLSSKLKHILNSKYYFVTYLEFHQENYRSGPRIFGQSSFGTDVSLALNLSRIQSIILW
jgi:hypothetical protein